MTNKQYLEWARTQYPNISDEKLLMARPEISQTLGYAAEGVRIAFEDFKSEFFKAFK